MTARVFVLEVQPKIPETLSRLEELASNLLYSWDRQVRGLFYRLDTQLWEDCGHNPKLFLKRVEQQKLEYAAQDPVFLQDYEKVLSSYNSYMNRVDQSHCSLYLNCDEDLISYSCAEFGLYESFPIYSGGLGILAGDYCKAMSDLNMPFVAVGMLYRQGYFNQTVDRNGNQIAHYIPSNFDDLPVSPAKNSDGDDIEISVPVCKRNIQLKVWIAKIGHIELLLLDSDIPANSSQDQYITHQLYGGNSTNRLLQEILLGIGGVKAKRALGLNPTVWHINEGHAAFQVLERCRELVVDSNIDFYSAMEAVAANTVFTTHTPVAAGHDIFDTSLIERHFSGYMEELGITLPEFLKLGSSPIRSDGFNMTALALRCSRFHNGVSRIHGSMASEMEKYIWPQIPVAENPMRYVTNGIHVHTFLADEWVNYFDYQIGGGWRQELLNEKFWKFIDDIPDYAFWSRRRSLKSRMLEAMLRRATVQHRRNGFSESQVHRLTHNLKPQKTDVLTIGFARRFATYKRATLIFSDEKRLARLLGDPERPIIILFAGKAHPLDKPGQDLIRQIHELSRKPEFEGKIIFIENYDISVARKLVSGVDVWLNNPEYPLEASGTSGQKAGINGVLNLSVLDGWWGEGYNGDNGWAITPHGASYTSEFRDQEEANELMDVLEQEVVPLYYDRDNRGFSPGWIEKSKASMKSLIPRFNSQRMAMDYARDFYAPAIAQGAKLRENNFENACQLSLWKKRIRDSWNKINIAHVGAYAPTLSKGTPLVIEVAVELSELSPEDIRVDCQFETGVPNEETLEDGKPYDCQTLKFVNKLEDGRALYKLSHIPKQGGLQSYKIRCYPFHNNLSEQFELGYMLWVE